MYGGHRNLVVGDALFLPGLKGYPVLKSLNWTEEFLISLSRPNLVTQSLLAKFDCKVVYGKSFKLCDVTFLLQSSGHAHVLI